MLLKAAKNKLSLHSCLFASSSQQLGFFSFASDSAFRPGIIYDLKKLANQTLSPSSLLIPYRFDDKVIFVVVVI